MKTPKIFSGGKLAPIFLFVGTFIGFFSCDVMEPDADSVNPQISIDEETIYMLSNGTAFIDLNSKVRTNSAVRLSITSTPQYGKLVDMGKGLLQYSSESGNKRIRDAFEFTAFSEDNTVLLKDTIVIVVENDSTNLPCGLYTVNDFVYGVTKNATYHISPLFNDNICGFDSTDLELTILNLADTFPPHHGNAYVQGQTIIYTANNSFDQFDMLIYKVTPSGDPSKAAYGMVYFNAAPVCNFSVKPDTFTFDSDSVTFTLFLPVFDNDTFCDSLSNRIVNIVEPPAKGNAQLGARGFYYKKSTTIDAANFSDVFFYEVCVSGTCKSARVDIKTRQDSTAQCEAILQAIDDSISISDSTALTLYIDVLKNDVICGSLTMMTISEVPDNGSAFVSTVGDRRMIGYMPNPSMPANDSLAYQICKNTECSTAKVYIKNE